VGSSFEDLATGATLGIADTVSFHAASTMKVPVMFELFRRADEGTLDLDARVPARNRFRSIVDGSPYSPQTPERRLRRRSSTTAWARPSRTANSTSA
jgi:beta-lactamase class A